MINNALVLGGGEIQTRLEARIRAVDCSGREPLPDQSVAPRAKVPRREQRDCLA
jgi:hypothetical protein